ncbi:MULTISPECIES: polysaccharide pyruvyl transferase family protein [unclassified Kaistella]|uniref:polysaccharide pyruvyl transferase family protein n=1 Tax=unclassified Kaistella TaxID=2762626 RepID=UPI002736204D|nr:MULTISPECIES: polysaccharide pyruvyl transferase family protein [unclassified Kaistella]MDP2452519.1 polysaccharide pyruvyl transferase family protein [Kaistella sp. SH11-4b]MDP2455427.1 polysaccharide pyruvyl transferase family protein [Kaistella sp. SH40-3]MDP2458331.1 polysaccharide pyruvyl transferase family protein [Kaistella sp. SH19-2b]
MKKINLYFHTGSRNHGCEAIVRGTNEVLRQKLRLFSFVPEDEIKYRLNEIVEVQSDQPVTIKKYRIPYLFSALQVKIFNKTTLVTQYRKRNFFSKIKKGDVCLSIGGDNYTYEGTWELADYNQILQGKGAKTVLWGCSIDDHLIPDLTGDLNRYNMIIARETLTFDALKKNGITTEIRLCPDAAFQLLKNEVQLPPNFIKGQTVGINLSPLILKYGNSALILKNFEHLVQHIISETDLQIALIPHVVVPGNDDREAMKPLYEKFKDSGRMVWVDDYNCSDLKGFISECRYFMGARTHATIAAYSTEVPTVVIGYSMKAKGIAKDLFGTHEHYVCPVQDFKTDRELIGSFQWLTENEMNIREHYRTAMPEYKAHALKAAEFLKEII